MFTKQIFKNYSKSTSALGLYILSAVRTPIGFLNGVLSDFTAPQLGSFAVKEALQRAVVPPKDLQNIFLGSASHSDCTEEIFRRTGLSKETRKSVSACGMRSLVEAVKFLQSNNKAVVMMGGVESFTNSSFDTQEYLQKNSKHIYNSRVTLNSLVDFCKSIRKDYKNSKEVRKGEIVKIDFRKKGQQIIVKEDEIYGTEKNDVPFESLMTCDGAAAFIISTEDYLQENDLVPLAKIISFIDIPSSSNDLLSVIKKSLEIADCQSKDITRWKIISDINCMNLSEALRNDNTFSLGYPVGMSGLTAVCHLIHSLSPGELGCVAGVDFSNTSLMIIKKLGGRKSNKPKVTLYTKHTCPLCDDLKQELKPFEGRFSLSEVDIERDENKKYRELYQYEIPVLFLDGIFLCKHRLDVEEFDRRLSLSESYVNV